MNNDVSSNNNGFIFKLVELLTIWAVSYFITAGFLYLIFACFDLKFDLKIATGIWLSFILFNMSVKFDNRVNK